MITAENEHVAGDQEYADLPCDRCGSTRGVTQCASKYCDMQICKECRSEQSDLTEELGVCSDDCALHLFRDLKTRVETLEVVACARVRE